MKFTIRMPWEKPNYQPIAGLPILGVIPNHDGMTLKAHAATYAKESSMSFLSTVGKDIKGIFGWLGSTKGEAVIHAGESVITTIDPGLAGIVALVDSWVQKVIATEALAVAAGQQEGSGVIKAAAVMNAMAPQVEQLFPAATVAQIANANTAIVQFLNSFDAAMKTPAAS